MESGTAANGWVVRPRPVAGAHASERHVPAALMVSTSMRRACVSEQLPSALRGKTPRVHLAGEGAGRVVEPSRSTFDRATLLQQHRESAASWVEAELDIVVDDSDVHGAAAEYEIVATHVVRVRRQINHSPIRPIPLNVP
jgi:hypothetical protein